MYSGFIAVGLLLLVLSVADVYPQNSLTRNLILLLYNPIFVYLVLMLIIKWVFSKLEKIEFISTLLADDEKKDGGDKNTEVI